jgi:hypothetical protein
MTPLNHLSPGPGSEEVRKLLHWHLEEQRKRKALEACSKTKAKMDELEDALTNVVGLHELKVQLRKWAKGMLLDERRRALGMKVGMRRPPHMAFLGSPGTGIEAFNCFWIIMLFPSYSVNQSSVLKLKIEYLNFSMLFCLHF